MGRKTTVWIFHATTQTRRPGHGLRKGNLKREAWKKSKKELEVDIKAKIYIDLLRETLKKLPYWKTPCHDGIHGFRF